MIFDIILFFVWAFIVIAILGIIWLVYNGCKDKDICMPAEIIIISFILIIILLIILKVIE
jgi:hypothetical protein